MAFWLAFGRVLWCVILFVGLVFAYFRNWPTAGVMLADLAVATIWLIKETRDARQATSRNEA